MTRDEMRRTLAVTFYEMAMEADLEAPDRIEAARLALDALKDDEAARRRARNDAIKRGAV